MLGSNNRLITPTSPPHTQTHPLYRVLLIFHNKPGAVYRPELQDPAVGDKSTNLGAADRESIMSKLSHSTLVEEEDSVYADPTTSRESM